MCYLVVERYSVCRCLYYKHTIDFCGAHGEIGHRVQERTLLVGYACDQHANTRQSASLWSSGNDITSQPPAHEKASDVRPISQQGVRITSDVALRALEDAKLAEDDDVSTKRFDGSVLETASTQTTIDNDPSYDVGSKKNSEHTSVLEDFRRRIRAPTQYVDSLKELEERVRSNSTASLYDVSSGAYNMYGDEDFIPYPIIPADLQDVLPNRLSDDPFSKDPTNTSDEEITALCQRTANRPTAAHLNAIRMCRNLILRTFLNLKLLQRSNFCGSSFSIMVVDNKRWNVAMLKPIENTDFIELVYEVEYILRDCASLVLNEIHSKRSLDIDGQFTFLNTCMVQQYCKSLLQIYPNSARVKDLGVVNILRSLVLMLDLALVSYAGAHCNEFLTHGSSGNQPICLLKPFRDCSEHITTSSVSLQRCSLRCLDPFHNGRKVWAFSPPKCHPSVSLYLSTTIDTFGDIWGPLWKLSDDNDPGKYSTYVVGSGSIVQWPHDRLTCPGLAESRFCHWISNAELEDGIQDTPRERMKSEYKPFDGTETLLIGAPTNTSHASSLEPWVSKARCLNSISKARTRLREAQRLCIVGASKPYHYNDSHQYQLQAGYSGINASATRQYKRVPGQSLKEILIELWAMEPEIRDPTLLEDLHGIEVSTCTYNAQRVSLARILGSECMQHLLRDFSWKDPEYRTEHFLTLGDTLRPRRVLDKQFKETFDRAVMLGLKMLSKTGVDREDNFRVFLSSPCTPKPELATLVSKEHSWVGLLKDTTTECAMAVFGDACLEFKHPDGVSCGQVGQSALKSAIVLHSSLSSSLFRMKLSGECMGGPADLKETRELSALPMLKTFSLGERGTLRLISRLSGGILEMGWTSQSRSMSLRERLGREPLHREYTEIDRSEGDGTTRPLPIIVVADKPRRYLR